MAARSAPGVLSMLLRFAVRRRSWRVDERVVLRPLAPFRHPVVLPRDRDEVLAQPEAVPVLDVVLAVPPILPLHVEHRVDVPLGLVAFEGEHDVDRRSGLALDRDVGEDPPRDIVVERADLVGLPQGRDVGVLRRKQVAEGNPFGIGILPSEAGKREHDVLEFGPTEKKLAGTELREPEDVVLQRIVAE